MPEASARPRGGHYRKSHIVSQGNGWKYRRTIPEDLRAAFGGRTAWVKSLGKNYVLAEIAAHAEDARNGALIQRWRALADSERALIVASGGIEAFRQHGVPVDDAGLPFLKAVANLELPTGDDADPEDGMSEDELAHATLTIVQARQHVAKAKAKKDSERKVAAKLDGIAKGAALLALVDLWERVRSPRSKTARQKTRLYVQRFVEIVGDLEPRQLTRAHVIKFREALEKRAFSAANITQHLDKVHTVFNVGMSEGELDINPAYKVKARKDTRKLSDRRQDFTSAQLRTILDKAESEREDYRWIIRLLAYHGARSGEICQLRCDDIATLNGIRVFRIHDRHEDNKVKNIASIRDVPLHPQCMGIVEYAQRIAKERGADDAPLFPNLKEHAQGRAHDFQNYASRVFLRETCGIKGRHHTMHSLRHSFRSMAREISMPRDVSRALMGHSLGRTDHDAYGSIPPLKLQAKWIKKIDPFKR